VTFKGLGVVESKVFSDLC